MLTLIRKQTFYKSIFPGLREMCIEPKCERLASQLVVERVYPDVVLRVRPEVGELAFDGVAREDGAILPVLPLVREEHLVAVVFLPRGLDRIELGAAIIGIPYRRTPLKQRTPRLDIGYLEE